MIERRACGPDYPGWEADDLGGVFYGGVEVAQRRHGKYFAVSGGHGGTILVHRLVCSAFHGPRAEDRPLALHYNDVGVDNRPENLRWGSWRDNVRDAQRNGGLPRAAAPARRPTRAKRERQDLSAKFGIDDKGHLLPDGLATKAQRAAREAIGLKA